MSPSATSSAPSPTPDSQPQNSTLVLHSSVQRYPSQPRLTHEDILRMAGAAYDTFTHFLHDLAGRLSSSTETGPISPNYHYRSLLENAYQLREDARQEFRRALTVLKTEQALNLQAIDETRWSLLGFSLQCVADCLMSLESLASLSEQSDSAERTWEEPLLKIMHQTSRELARIVEEDFALEMPTTAESAFQTMANYIHANWNKFSATTNQVPTETGKDPVSFFHEMQKQILEATSEVWTSKERRIEEVFKSQSFQIEQSPLQKCQASAETAEDCSKRLKIAFENYQKLDEQISIREEQAQSLNTTLDQTNTYLTAEEDRQQRYFRVGVPTQLPELARPDDSFYSQQPGSLHSRVSPFTTD